MEICITNARGRLTDLIRIAETGDDIILTRNGIAVARLVPFHEKAVIEPDPRLDRGDQIRGTREKLDAVRA